MIAVSKKALIYTRVSTEGQEDNTSLDDQLRACREYAVTNGYKVVHELRELHTGAEFFERPELTFARKLISEKQIQAFIVRDVDRLSRDLGFLSYFQHECAQADVELIIVADPIDSSPEGKVWQSLKGYFAEEERRKIKLRLMRGRKAVLTSGRIHNAGIDKYGWRRNKEKGVREIYEPEAAIVRKIFEMAADGFGTRSVARQLHEAGYPPPTVGKKIYAGNRIPLWGKSTINRILKDTDYKGESYGWKYQFDKKRNTLSIRPRSEWVPLPAEVCPAIVSAELWDKAAAQTKKNKGEKKRNVTRPFLLRGLISCAVCGRRMVAESEHGELAVYRCASRQTTLGNCGAKRVNGSRADAIVFEQVKKWLDDSEQLVILWSSQPIDNADEEHLDRQIKTLEKDIAGLDKAINRYLKLIGDASDESLIDTYQGEFERRHKRRQGIDRQIVELKMRLYQLSDRQQQILTKLETARELKKLDFSEFEQRRQILEVLKVKVLGNGKNIKIILE